MGSFSFLATKYLITAALVVLISEVAKYSGKFGALIAALPMVTVLVLIWLHIENQPVERIANHAWYTFWYVIPTLPMFLAFPYLLNRFSFWAALGISVLITLICFVAFAIIVKSLGVELL
jgi:F0F1-type ATP synthase assembly protein I